MTTTSTATVDPNTGMAYVLIGEVDASGNVSDMVQASGVLVAPDEVLTAAHVIYGTNGLRTSGTVIMDYNKGTYTTTDSVAGVHVVAQADYTTDAGEQTDYALIHLSTPVTGGTVFNLAAFGGNGTYNVSGYPAGTGGALDTQSEQVTKESSYTVLNGATLSQGTNNAHGSSGGPVWTTVNGTPTVEGVISAESSDGTTGFFTQMTATTVAQIQSWIAQDHPTTAAPTPTIAGAQANQATTAEHAVAPFANVTIGDANAGSTESLTITLTGGAGTLSGTGLVANANGSYTLAGTAAAVTTQLQALRFAPVNGTPNSTSTTTFALSDASSAGTSVTNASTTVVDTAAAVAPSIVGARANQATTAERAVSPFSGVKLADANAGATDTLTITVSGAAGALSGSGLVANANGTYTLAGSAATVTSQLQSLRFTPAGGAPNSATSTTFALSDASSAGTSATDATTSVVDTAAAVAPTIVGAQSNQATSAEHALSPFANVTLGDANSAATERLTISLSGGTGSLSGAGLASNADGTYALTGSAASVTKQLEALRFTPVGGAPNSTSTTTLALSLASSAGTSATNASTTVIDTAAAIAPAISGTRAGQDTNGEATLSPFSGVTVADANSGAVDGMVIALSGMGGTLSGAGLVAKANGTYGLAPATAAGITSELHGITFTPAAGGTTTFTLSDASNAGTSTVDAVTTVVDHPIAPTPVVTTPVTVAPTPVVTSPEAIVTGPVPVIVVPVVTSPTPVATNPDPVVTTPIATDPSPVTVTPVVTNPDPVVITPVTSNPDPMSTAPGPTPNPIPVTQTPVTTAPDVVPGFTTGIVDGLAADAAATGGGRGMVMNDVSQSIANALSQGGSFEDMVYAAGNDLMNNSSRPMRALAYLGGLLQGATGGAGLGQGLIGNVNAMFGGGVVTNAVSKSVAIAGYSEGSAMQGVGMTELAAAISGTANPAGATQSDATVSAPISAASTIVSPHHA